MDIRKVFEKTVSNNPNKPAFIFGEKSISFHELQTEVVKLANGLKSSGVGKEASLEAMLEHFTHKKTIIFNMSWVISLQAKKTGQNIT